MLRRASSQALCGCVNPPVTRVGWPTFPSLPWRGTILARPEGDSPMRCVLLLLAVLSLAFAPVPPYRPKPNQRGLDELQGVWDIVHYSHQGRNLTGMVSRGNSLIVEGKRWKYDTPSSTSDNEYEIKLEATKSPKQIDL